MCMHAHIRQFLIFIDSQCCFMRIPLTTLTKLIWNISAGHGSVVLILVALLLLLLLVVDLVVVVVIDIVVVDIVVLVVDVVVLVIVH